MQIRPNKSWLLLGVGILLGASAAFAASSRYDEATASIDKAAALLSNVGDEKQHANFQRERALKALARAKVRVACAKAASDTGKKGCPATKGSKFDDNDDDEKEHDNTPDHPPKQPKEPEPPKQPKDTPNHPPKQPKAPEPPKQPKAPASPKAPANP